MLRGQIRLRSSTEEIMMKLARMALAPALALLSATCWAQAAGTSDAQIAAIVVTANQLDIEAGTLAESKSPGEDVKQIAQQMVTDHTGVDKSATDLVTKLKVKTEENDTSKSLQKGG